MRAKRIIKWELSGVHRRGHAGQRAGAWCHNLVLMTKDDLKQLCGRASRRDWAFCPVAFASGLSETSYGWSGSLEGLGRARGLSSFARWTLPPKKVRLPPSLRNTGRNRSSLRRLNYRSLAVARKAARLRPYIAANKAALSYQQIARAQEIHARSRAENAPISPLATIGTA